MNNLNRPVSKVTPIVIALFFVAIIILYGFFSVYYRQFFSTTAADGTVTTTQNMDKGAIGICMLMMDTVFTMVGFGLLLSAYKHQKWTGMSIALFVVSFNIILGLLFQDLWFEIFFGFRKNLTDPGNGSVIAPNARQFWDRHSTASKATASFLSFRLSNLCSTSFLVGMTAWNGRVTFTNIVLSLPIFCFCYYLNLYLNALACYSTANKDSSFSYFDAYGTIVVYLFGSVYGIIAGALTKTSNQNASQIERSGKSKTSLQFSTLGAFFIFATFCLSYTGILTGSTANAQAFRFNSQAILVMFGLASGILGNYAAQLLIGQGRANIQGIIIGTITGGIMVGGLADVIQNIGAVLFIAFVAGAVAGVFAKLVNPKVNSSSIIDSHGLLGPILVVSIIACFVIHPSILSQFFIRNSTLTPRGTGSAQTDFRAARFHLVYFGITLGCAIVTGLIIGVIFKIKRNPNRDYQDTKFFVDDYGLFNHQGVTNTAGYAPAPALPTSQSFVPESQSNLHAI